MNKCPKPPKHLIEIAKQSQYGCVWFTPTGIVSIKNNGEYGWYGKPLPQMKEMHNGK